LTCNLSWSSQTLFAQNGKIWDFNNSKVTQVSYYNPRFRGIVLKLNDQGKFAFLGKGEVGCFILVWWIFLFLTFSKLDSFINCLFHVSIAMLQLESYSGYRFVVLIPMHSLVLTWCVTNLLNFVTYLVNDHVNNF